MTKTSRRLFSIPYFLWMVFFVILPLLLIFGQSFYDIHGQFTFQNYINYFTSSNYLLMTLNSILYAFLVTFVTLIISYPTAYLLSKTKHKRLWLLLIILPTWINLLLKVYAFIGIFSQTGTVNDFLSLFGIAPQQILFTDLSFLTVAAYIELPFMILPIFNSIEELPLSLVAASRDLGATRFETLKRVIFPLTLTGVKSGIQAVFIPSLSLFMLTRLIGGNRVITLGTAVQEHFLVTQNWGMGSTIGVVLIVAMVILMLVMKVNSVGGADK